MAQQPPGYTPYQQQGAYPPYQAPPAQGGYQPYQAPPAQQQSSHVVVVQQQPQVRVYMQCTSSKGLMLRGILLALSLALGSSELYTFDFSVVVQQQPQVCMCSIHRANVYCLPGPWEPEVVHF